MKWHLSISLALAGVLAAAGVNAQYADELGKLAPEALKGGAKPRQGARIVSHRDTGGGELADTIRMQEYSDYRNYHRIRGWVYALHHLLTTGKPVARYS